MRLIKMLGVTLLGVSGLVSVSVSADVVVKEPVSCSWVHTGSQSGPNAATVTFQCKESNGNVAATRNLTYSAPSWQVTYCTISTHGNVKYSGTCQSPSLYRDKILTCNSGVYIASGCANSLTASAGFGAAAQQICGSGCPVRYENLGGTNGCYRESPYLNAYCQ